MDWLSGVASVLAGIFCLWQLPIGKKLRAVLTVAYTPTAAYLVLHFGLGNRGGTKDEEKTFGEDEKGGGGGGGEADSLGRVMVAGFESVEGYCALSGLYIYLRCFTQGVALGYPIAPLRG